MALVCLLLPTNPALAQNAGDPPLLCTHARDEHRAGAVLHGAWQPPVAEADPRFDITINDQAVAELVVEYRVVSGTLDATWSETVVGGRNESRTLVLLLPAHVLSELSGVGADVSARVYAVAQDGSTIDILGIGNVRVDASGRAKVPVALAFDGEDDGDPVVSTGDHGGSGIGLERAVQDEDAPNYDWED